MNIREISNVLLSCFSSSELEHIVTCSVGPLREIRHEITWRNAPAHVTFDLVDIARRRGLLPELLHKAALERPSRADMMALAAAHPFNPGVPVATAAPPLALGLILPKVMVYRTTPEVLQAINSMLDDFEPVEVRRSVFWLLTFIQDRIAELVTLPARLKTYVEAAHQRDPLVNPSLASFMTDPAKHAQSTDIRVAEIAADFVRLRPNPSRGWTILRRGGLDDTTTRFAREPISLVTAEHVNAINSLAEELGVACKFLEQPDVCRALCIGRDGQEVNRLHLAGERLDAARAEVEAVREKLVSETKAEADPFAAWGA